MKIALFIFPIGPSHGSILQTFALYHMLKDLGHDVTVIHKLKPRLNFLQVCKRALKIIKSGGIGKVPIFYTELTHTKVLEKFNKFIKDNVSIHFSEIHSERELKIEGRKNYDAFIVGSDQTWRPEYVPNILNYYLNFVPNTSKAKRIAYATSFGVSHWMYTVKQTETCSMLSKKFCNVSVREKSGIDLCKKYLGINATFVVDPTLLYTDDFYCRFLENEQDIPLNACCCYILDKSTIKENIINKVLHIKKAQRININTQSENILAPISERIPPSIGTWLNGFSKGSFMVVDSYHALLFSVIFNKPFIVIGNKSRGLERFKSFLELIKLENRLVENESDITNDLINSIIDWNSINAILKNKRKESIDFLINSLR